MIRSLMGLLIIAVIFLAGMVVGIGKEEQASISDTTESMDFNSDLQENELIEKEAEYPAAIEKMSEEDTPNHLTQKMASSLESIVKGFYEMVVQLCYTFANLFF